MFHVKLNIMPSTKTEFTLDAEWVRQRLPKRTLTSHKGDNGHVLIVVGSAKMPGAAVLAARAALRAGAGLVTVASIKEVCLIVAHHLPEAILLPLPEKDGVIDPKAADLLLDAEPHYKSALLGPGLSRHENIPKFLSKLFASWSLPACIDADALNAISEGVRLPDVPCVLTPHPGEMGRLLGMQTVEVQENRLEAIQKAVKKYRQTVILKGANSLCLAPSRPIAVNSTGNPGMAAAGMGDVLGGVVVTLLAQGLAPYDAGACAVYWHGLSGDRCQTSVGDQGFLATEVANQLPLANKYLLRNE